MLHLSPYARDMRPPEKTPAPPLSEKAEAVELHLRFAREVLNADIPSGARVLDFGCGIGESVALLVERGYDAVGIDVREYWGREHDLYWHTTAEPPAAIKGRLSVVDLQNYRLPYPDDSIDFCFSDQVFEHVFDYVTPFREIARVLKPGAISLHRFPGPNRLFENHVNLPMPRLCRHDSYLAMCSFLSATFRGGDWRTRYQSSREIMGYTNYPSAAALRRHARAAGAAIAFHEAEDFLFRGGGRFSRQINIARRLGAGHALATLAKPLLLRYMSLKRTENWPQP